MISVKLYNKLTKTGSILEKHGEVYILDEPDQSPQGPHQVVQTYYIHDPVTYTYLTPHGTSTMPLFDYPLEEAKAIAKDHHILIPAQ